MNTTLFLLRARRSHHGAVVGVMVLVWMMLIGIAAWRSWQDRAAWIERDTAETANLARSLAQHAHDAVQAADTAIVDLRALIEIEGTGPRTRDQLLGLMATQLAASPVVSAFVAFDADGNWIVNSRRTSPYNVADPDYFRFHATHPDRGARIGEPILSTATGTWVVPVTRRIDAPDGRFAGVMLAMLPAEVFLKFQASFDIGHEGEIILLGTGGTIVAHTRLGEDGTGRSLADTALFRDLLASPSSRSLDYVSSADGVRRLGSARRMDDLPFIVVASHGYDEALSRWRIDTRASLALGLAASLVVLLLGARLARQVRRGEQVEDALSRSETHYRLIAENSTDLIARLDAGLQRTYVSPSSETLTGYTPQELLGGHLGDFVHPQDWPDLSASLGPDTAQDAAPNAVRDTAPVSFRFTRKDGAEIWLEATGRRMEGDGGHVMTLRDVTRRRKSEKQLHDVNNQLQRLMMQDGLTGVANRRCLDVTLQKELRRQARAALPLALLMIDIDHFRAFNDALGHAAGDTCLRAVATALAKHMQRPADLVARFGGEEFAVVLPETDTLGAMVVAERVRRAVCSLAIAHAGNPAGVATVSIGVAVAWARRAALPPKDLIALAEGALHRAKHGGRNRTEAAAEPLGGHPAKVESAALAMQS